MANCIRFFSSIPTQAKVGSKLYSPLGPETVQHWTRRRRTSTSSPLSCGSLQHRPDCLLWLEETAQTFVDQRTRKQDCRPTLQICQTAQPCGRAAKTHPASTPLLEQEDKIVLPYRVTYCTNLWRNTEM